MGLKPFNTFDFVFNENKAYDFLSELVNSYEVDLIKNELTIDFILYQDSFHKFIEYIDVISDINLKLCDKDFQVKESFNYYVEYMGYKLKGKKENSQYRTSNIISVVFQIKTTL